MPLSATPVAYRRPPLIQAGFRALGWALTLFPGMLVALLESLTDAGAEVIAVFEVEQ
jgi:hypothetical protein